MNKYSFFATDTVHAALRQRSKAIGRSLNAEARRLIKSGFTLFLAQGHTEIPSSLRTGDLIHKLTIYSRGDQLFEEVRAYALQHEISPPQLFNALIFLAVQVTLENDQQTVYRMLESTGSNDLHSKG